MAANRRQIYRKRDRLRQLLAFCLAARLGSISQAAEHLGLGQQAVSLHVRELEFELEAILFERGGWGLRLTVAGKRLYSLAGPLVEETQELFNEFTVRADDDMTGRLDIAASTAGTANVLPAYVKRLRDQYPGVRLRVRNCGLGEGMEFLRAGEVEFVLGGCEPLEDYAFEYREMLSYDIVLITSRDHPLAGRETVTPQEAAQWPAIVPLAGSYSRQFSETVAREFGVDLRAVIEVGGWGVIKRYVERGIGICVAPSICINETDQVSVIPLKDYVPARGFGVYTRRGKALTAPARRFLELLIPGSAQSSGRPRRAGNARAPRAQVAQ